MPIKGDVKEIYFAVRNKGRIIGVTILVKSVKEEDLYADGRI
ncbi:MULTISPECIES: hypothetical protein [Bacillus]|nr:hypothetical protein [Bacillus cereus]MDA2639637.1 hypothetical protein [Bacillus cereus]